MYIVNKRNNIIEEFLFTRSDVSMGNVFVQ